MTAQINRPYGTWPSPISTGMLAGALRLNDVQWDTGGDTLVWSEGRGGQGVLVAQSGVDAPRDLTGDLSVKGRVGYGGGDFTVHEGTVYFSASDGRLYKQALAGGGARPITPAYGGAAGPRVSPDGRWVAFVHTYEGVDGIAVVDSMGMQWPRKLAYGSDFAMQPVWHPEGDRLAYIRWDHPNMPWDGSEPRLLALTTADVPLPVVKNEETIAGDAETSIFQPEFSPDGRYLTYVSDKTGYWQLYVYDLTERTHVALTVDEAEHGIPAWIQGMRTYGWTPSGDGLYFLRNARGIVSVWRFHLQTGQSRQVDGLDAYSHVEQIAISPRQDAIAMIASGNRIPERIISHTPAAKGDEHRSGVVIHRRATSESVPAEELADAEAIAWTGDDGETVHGLYYPPTSARFTAEGAPPLIVRIHGGPTSQTMAAYDGKTQFFATRGFAVLEVNYRGSTGYGRAYRDRLHGAWGVVDVDDAASGARHLAEQGMADGDRLVILGSSAGGYTVLQSLVQKPGFYRAGVSLYGVSNLFMLAQDTHKFEERYTDWLVGALPEAANVYRERSPLFHADRIADPLILFQGTEDTIVPRDQSDSLVAALKRGGVPHEYHVYEGEGHGFRQPDTIAHVYSSTLRFLMQHVIYA